MSIPALNWASHAVAGSPAKKAVLWVLANYADEGWSCYPSQGTISLQSEVPVRSVRRILQEWEDTGLIERRHRCSLEGRGRTSDRIFIIKSRWEVRPDLEANSDLEATGDDLEAKSARPRGQSLADDPKEEPKEEPLALPLLEPSLETVPAAQSVKQIEADFEVWYAAYPRKKKPADARRAYVKARKVATAEELLLGATALARLVESRRQELKFTPYPSSWLNGECWREVPDAEPNPFEGPPMRFE